LCNEIISGYPLACTQFVAKEILETEPDPEANTKKNDQGAIRFIQ
jgi:hypothetical protein